MKYNKTIAFIISFCFSTNLFSQNIKNDILQINKNTLILEMRIGEGSGLKGDFIIAGNSGSLAVNDNGDIIITDEYKIKIYDKNGKPLKVIGRKGQGPGEYETFPKINLGLKGYLTGYNDLFDNSIYNLYSEKYVIIKTKRITNDIIYEKYIKNKKLKDVTIYDINSVNNLYPINANEMLCSILIKDYFNETPYKAILKVSDNNIEEIYFSKEPEYIITKNRSIVNNGLLGRFFWGVTSNGQIIIYNSDTDEHSNNKTSKYNIYIIDIVKGNKNKLDHNFQPEVFKKEYIDNLIRNRKVFKLSSEFFSKKEEVTLKSKKYMYALSKLLIENNYIFAYLKEREREKYLVDVFDISKMSYVKSFEIPLDFPTNIINNGYLYCKTDDENGYPEIRKYKITSNIYGK